MVPPYDTRSYLASGRGSPTIVRDKRDIIKSNCNRNSLSDQLFKIEMSQAHIVVLYRLSQVV